MHFVGVPAPNQPPDRPIASTVTTIPTGTYGDQRCTDTAVAITGAEGWPYRQIVMASR